MVGAKRYRGAFLIVGKRRRRLESLRRVKPPRPKVARFLNNSPQTVHFSSGKIWKISAIFFTTLSDLCLLDATTLNAPASFALTVSNFLRSLNVIFKYTFERTIFEYLAETRKRSWANNGQLYGN